jgi:uracil-DNA glycosylase family 4
VQCYPGPSSYRPGDRKPSLTESTTCLARGYLLRELLTVRPRVVLLMGNAARTAFFRYILFERCRDSLGKHIARIRKSRALPRVTIAQVEVALAPIYHPSGANPHFRHLSQDARIIALIRKALLPVR